MKNRVAKVRSIEGGGPCEAFWQEPSERPPGLEGAIATARGATLLTLDH
jgi:hypothetical protein